MTSVVVKRNKVLENLPVVLEDCREIRNMHKFNNKLFCWCPATRAVKVKNLQPTEQDTFHVHSYCGNLATRSGKAHSFM